MAASAPADDFNGYYLSAEDPPQLSFHSIQPAPVPPPLPLAPSSPPPPQFYEPMVRGSLLNLNVDVAQRQPHVPPQLQSSTSWVPPPPPSWPPPPDTPVYPIMHRPQFPHPPSSRPPPPRYPSIVASHPDAPLPVRHRRTFCFKLMSAVVTVAIIIVVIAIIRVVVM